MINDLWAQQGKTVAAKDQRFLGYKLPLKLSIEEFVYSFRIFWNEQ